VNPHGGAITIKALRGASSRKQKKLRSAIQDFEES